MKESSVGSTPSQDTPSQETNEVHEKRFKSAITKFLTEEFAMFPERLSNHYGFDFDISAPKKADLDSLQSGDFEITNFQTSPTSDPEKLGFTFYVGDTEFHISGKAADRVYELMEE
ncbi:MAG: hypothetical protein WCW66_04655 [Patescibacteria group bacterium]|jgi:hypothetical protein